MAGAPQGNTNRLTHGGRSRRPGVVLPTLGKKHRRVYADVLALRAALESALKTSGRLTLAATLRVQTICRLEMAIRLTERRIATETLTVDQEQPLRLSIIQWTFQRDNAVQTLVGDAKVSDLDWDRVLSRKYDNEYDNETDKPARPAATDHVFQITGQ